MVIVIMGVAGCGKTTVGRLLARKLGLPFHDGDDFHSCEAREKMRAGIPLADEDRQPWLERLAVHVVEWNRQGGGVLACSALKATYRCTLSQGQRHAVLFVHLVADRATILDRLAARTGHYFPADLMQSQFETLEVSEDAISVDACAEPEAICAELCARLEPLLSLPAAVP